MTAIKINFNSDRSRLRTCLGLWLWAPPYLPSGSHLENDKEVHGAVTAVYLPSHIEGCFLGQYNSRCFQTSSNESAFRIKWPKYWSFSFSISPSNEYSGLISFRMDWLDLLAVQGTLKSLL